MEYNDKDDHPFYPGDQQYAFSPSNDDLDLYDFVGVEYDDCPSPSCDDSEANPADEPGAMRKRKRDDDGDTEGLRSVERRLLSATAQTLDRQSPAAVTPQERSDCLQDWLLSPKVQASLLEQPELQGPLDAVIQASRRPQNNSQPDQRLRYSLDLPACLVIPHHLLALAQAIGAVDPAQAIVFLLPMLKGALSTKNLDVALQLLRQTETTVGEWLNRNDSRLTLTEASLLRKLAAKANEKRQQLEALDAENATRTAFLDSLEKINDKIHAPRQKAAPPPDQPVELEVAEFLGRYFTGKPLTASQAPNPQADKERSRDAAATMCHENDRDTVMEFIWHFENYVARLAFAQSLPGDVIKRYLDFRQAVLDVCNPGSPQKLWDEAPSILVQTSITQNINLLGDLVEQWCRQVESEPKEFGKMQELPPSAQTMGQILFGLKHLGDEPAGEDVWHTVIAPIDKQGGIECMGKSQLLFDLRLQYLAQRVRWSSRLPGPVDTPSGKLPPEEITSQTTKKVAQLLSDAPMLYRESEMATLIDLLSYLIRDLHNTKKTKADLKALHVAKEQDIQKVLNDLGYGAKLFDHAPDASNNNGEPSPLAGFASALGSFAELVRYLRSTPNEDDYDFLQKLNKSDAEQFESIIDDYLKRETDNGLDEHTAPIISARGTIFEEVYLAVKYHLAPLALGAMRQHLAPLRPRELAQLLIHDVLLLPIDASASHKTPYKLTLVDAQRLWPQLIEFIPNLDHFCKAVEAMLQEMLEVACQASAPPVPLSSDAVITPKDVKLRPQQTRFILLVLIMNQHLIATRRRPIELPKGLWIHRKINTIVDLVCKGERTPPRAFLNATDCTESVYSADWKDTWTTMKAYWREHQWEPVADELLPVLKRIAHRHLTQCPRAVLDQIQVSTQEQEAEGLWIS